MNKVKKISALTVIFLGIMLVNIKSMNVYAYTHLNFRNITNEDGLSQATVESIIQDKKGYIWIGTNDGLNRYNGYDFKVYRHDDEDKNTITNNYIVDLEEDRKGNLWIGTANGLSKLNPKNNKITNYSTEFNEGDLSHYNIGQVLVTKKGDILVGTSDGLNIYNEKTDRFERIMSKESDLTNQHIYTLTEDENEDIWVGTKTGVTKIDTKIKKTYKFYTSKNKEFIENNLIYDIYSDKKGYVWVGSYRDGLTRINIKTNETKTYLHNNEDDNSLPGDCVRSILKDTNGVLWVGTNEGLARYNEKEDNFNVYKNKVYDKNSLVEDEIFNMIEDKSGLIWIGTYCGISVFNPENKIEHYKNDPFDKNSIAGNSIQGIYEDDGNLLWVGTNSKGVNIIDRNNNRVYKINKEFNSNLLNDMSINDIKGSKNKIFIGTNNGLNIINKDTNTVDLYTKQDGLPDNNIRTLFLDSKGCLWIGTIDGISILNTSNNEMINITKLLKDNSIKDTYARVIYEDKEGIYWIGCFIDGGLIKIDPHKNSIKCYKNNKDDKSTISSNIIRSIGEDNKGNLWIGTSYGLNKLDKEKNIFTRYTTKDGLSNNIIYGILIDDYDNPWVSTNLGICKLDIKTNNFENFGITDGLQGNEFNGSAYYKNKNGEFIFGGINGINIFNPKEVEKSNSTPKVEFDEFEVSGNKYTSIDGRKFKKDENFLKISVFMPDYKNNKNIQYYYKLEGTSSDWHTIDSNYINYSNLSPGKYIFKIKAMSHNGVMSEESKVQFTIKPSFWLSNWALLIYISVIIVIIYLNINRMKRLDRLVRKKTSQLSNEMDKSSKLLNKVIDLEKSKNNYFVNLSHELRTPLNVIYTSEQLITQLNNSKNGITKDKLNTYMKVIRVNSKRLLSLINNIIDGTKIEHGNYKLNIEENDIVYVVEEATLSLKQYIENKGINLIIDPEIEEKIIKCDAYEIERCIVNLVSNAAKFTPEGGTIEVTIKDLGKKVQICVKDTGIGIDKKYHDSIFNKFNQVDDCQSKLGSGLGLTITKHIIEMHNGKIYLESELNKGSKFTIIL